MLRKIRKTSSIKNLFTASCSGQIATLLTLAMVIVLIVIVATIKVGSLSTKATTVSNAADSSALLLASQLSTKAYQLWDSLEDDPNDGQGTTEKCKKSSFLSMLFGAIFAIIAITVLAIIGGGIGFLAAHMIVTMVVGAVAGAVGGAVGAMASGTNVLQGAAQGAAIGAAIGGIAAGTAGVMNPASTAVLAPVSAPLTGVTLSQGVGLIGSGVFGLGSTIYKAMSEASATDKSLSQAARALNGLPETDTYREQVFLNALSQTIEDQNTTKTMGICKEVIDGEKKECEDGDRYDPYDANNNGDKNEVISYFSYWWDRRVKDLKKLFPKLQSRTQDFIKCDSEYQLYQGDPKNKSCKNDDGKDGDSWKTMPKDGEVPLKDFRFFAQSQYNAAYQCEYSSTFLLNTGSDEYSYNPCLSYGYSDEYSTGSYSPFWSPGPLYRPGLSGKDGKDAEWKKYLMDDTDKASRDTCVYDSSSSAEQFKQYKESLGEEPLNIKDGGVVVALAEDMEAKGVGVSFYKSGLTTREEKDSGDACDTCALGTHHDELEAVVDELNSFVDAFKDLNKQSAEKLTSTWESWIKWFYDERKVVGEENCLKNTEENTDDYYDTLQVLVNGEDMDCNEKTGEKGVTLRDCSQEDHPAITDSDGNEITVDELQGIKAWKEELNNKKNKYINKLPACELSASWGTDINGDGIPDYYNDDSYYANYPCYDSASKIVTIDGDQEDEFWGAVSALQTLIDEIGEGDDPPNGSIRYEMKKYYKDMNKLYESSTINYGGKNPVTYKWRDSACPASYKDKNDWDNDCDTEETGFCHSIKVQTSDFKAPWVKKKKSSAGFLTKKTCLTLTDYCYDPDEKHIRYWKNGIDYGFACKNSYNPVWVQIDKKDITGQDMGIMGRLADGGDEPSSCESLTNEQKAEDEQVKKNKLERVKIKKKARAYFSYYKLGLEDWEEKSK